MNAWPRKQHFPPTERLHEQGPIAYRKVSSQYYFIVLIPLEFIKYLRIDGGYVVEGRWDLLVRLGASFFIREGKDEKNKELQN